MLLEKACPVSGRPSMYSAPCPTKLKRPRLSDPAPCQEFDWNDFLTGPEEQIEGQATQGCTHGCECIDNIWQEVRSLKLRDAMHGMGCCKVVVIGRTGDGKSALCNLISRRLGMPQDPFQESDSALSHTHAPAQCQVGTLLVKDTPGLMDSGGVDKDETNIRLIVEDLRAGGYVNACVLVINEQAPRFDSGMQDAVKLIVDSFGAGCLGHLGFVFTKAFGQTTPEGAQSKASEFAGVISNRTHAAVAHIPAWQVDSHPEHHHETPTPVTQHSSHLVRDSQFVETPNV